MDKELVNLSGSKHHQYDAWIRLPTIGNDCTQTETGYVVARNYRPDSGMQWPRLRLYVCFDASFSKGHIEIGSEIRKHKRDRWSKLPGVPAELLSGLQEMIQSLPLNYVERNGKNEP